MCGGRSHVKRERNQCFNCGNAADEQYSYFSKKKRVFFGLIREQYFVYQCSRCGLKYITCKSGRGFRVFDTDGTLIKNHDGVSHGYYAMDRLKERGVIK